jgi:rubredoxin
MNMHVVSSVGEISPTAEHVGVLGSAFRCEQHGIVTEPMFDETDCPECELAAEEKFWDYDDRGMCPVCSMEQGKDVPILPGSICACGGFENVN